MNVVATRCECCNDAMYHIPIDNECVTYDPDHVGFCIHLSEEDMTSLYFEFKEYKTGLKEVPANA